MGFKDRMSQEGKEDLYGKKNTISKEMTNSIKEVSIEISGESNLKGHPVSKLGCKIRKFN